MRSLRVSPFGDVRSLPTCPHCGKEMGWWAAQNMKHMSECPENPKTIARLNTLRESLTGMWHPVLPHSPEQQEVRDARHEFKMWREGFDD